MKFESVRNVSKIYVFRKDVAPQEKGYIDQAVVAHGFIENVRIRFAAGENGTLRIRPVMIIPQEIEVDLLSYPDSGDRFVAGDNEDIEAPVRFETERKAVLRVYYENMGDPGTANSVVNVDIGVQYFHFSEPENIIGPRR